MQDKHLITDTNNLLTKIETDIENRMVELKQDQKNTDFLGAIAFVFIGVIALMNLYFLYDWGLEVKSIVHEMNSMHGQINIISEQMIHMGQLVKVIESDTALIPIMNEEMDKFVGSMQQMQQQTQNINLNMGNMNTSFTGISQDLGQMNMQIQGLNQQMGTMNVNIHEMSRMVP